MRRNTTESFVLRIALFKLKLIFQALCLIILIYQFIDITSIYLNFPYEVKSNVEDHKGLNLPSITFCLKRDHFWKKTNHKSMKLFS
jgi:hypothetical protein